MVEWLNSNTDILGSNLSQSSAKRTENNTSVSSQMSTENSADSYYFKFPK